eukprot:IDg7572t1
MTSNFYQRLKLGQVAYSSISYIPHFLGLVISPVAIIS